MCSNAIFLCLYNIVFVIINYKIVNYKTVIVNFNYRICPKYQWYWNNGDSILGKDSYPKIR